MITHKMLLMVVTGATAIAIPQLAGCSKQAPAPTAPAPPTHDEHEGHTAEDHAAMGHSAEEHAAMEKHGEEHEHEHGDEALTVQDVTLPTSFAAGVVRLNELQKKIEHLIEHNELADVHRVAEEMAVVARKMKELAQHDVAEDNRAEAGRLCNEIANYFHPIDEAADAGKKDETMAIHMQMVETIGKLESVTKK